MMAIWPLLSLIEHHGAPRECRELGGQQAGSAQRRFLPKA
jgi:hypothetical protein